MFVRITNILKTSTFVRAFHSM
jgi:broad specificity phosphatase PhoE